MLPEIESLLENIGDVSEEKIAKKILSLYPWANGYLYDLYEQTDQYGTKHCCLVCPDQKPGCKCYKMVCMKCTYYVPLKYTPSFQHPHCGYAELSDHHGKHSVDVKGLDL